jgi:mycothiol synthase
MSSVVSTDFLRRALEPRDLQPAFELNTICEMYDVGEIETTIEDLQTEWEAPNLSLETDSWGIFTKNEHLVAYGKVLDFSKDHVQLYAPSYVHPEYRGHGLGSELLQKQEARARELVNKAPSGVRVLLNKGTVNTNDPAHQLFEQNGFQLVRHFYQMQIEMQELPPTPQLGSNLKIRTFIKGQDNRAVFDADTEAFRDHWGSSDGNFEEWEHWTVNRESFDPSLWFLAVEGDEIAGIALCHNEMPTKGWVDTLGVRRNWRKQGVGLALLHHAFREFYERGRRKVGLGVDASSLTGATRLYERAGMRAIVQYDRYQKELRSGHDLTVQTLS